MKTVDSDLAAVLEAAGLSLVRPPTANANLFLGVMPEDDDSTVPDRCVAILETGGRPPVPFVGGGRVTYRRVTCQVRVRGPREDFANGQTLARAVLDALNLATVSGYVQVRVRESAPFYGGTDQSDRHGWAMNVEAEFEDPGP